MSRMTKSRYEESAAHAGKFLLTPLPRAGFVDEHEEVTASAGVYVMCTRTDEILYTGSAHRPGDQRGLVLRMREHLREESRRMHWQRAWLVPMSAEATQWQVRLVEGMIGRDLGCPANKRLPRILPAWLEANEEVA